MTKRFKMVITGVDGSFYYLDTVTGERIKSTLELENKLNELNNENEQLYELIDFANTLIAFKTSESCQKEWEKRLKELKE